MFQYLSYAHVLLQKDPITSDELEAIRPVNPFENGISKVFSYGKVFTQSCTPSDEKLSHYICYPTADNSNVNDNEIGKHFFKLFINPRPQDKYCNVFKFNF